jgi:ribonuclease HI
MALRSVMEAFRGLAQSRIPLRVVFTSDSLYLIKGLGEWVHGWAGHEWTRPRHGGSSRARSPIENVALWREAVRIIRDAGHAYEWRWVRGHDGHAQNEYANFLAMRAAADQTTSDGLAPSGFAAWLAAKRARRGGIGAPADFPDGATFRPARPLPEP